MLTWNCKDGNISSWKKTSALSCMAPLSLSVCACSTPLGTVLTLLLFSKILPPAPVCGTDLRVLYPHPQCAAILFTLLVCTAWPGGFGKRGLMPSWDHSGSTLSLPFISLKVQGWSRSCILTFILHAAPFDLQNWLTAGLSQPCIHHWPNKPILVFWSCGVPVDNSAPNPVSLCMSPCHP